MSLGVRRVEVSATRAIGPCIPLPLGTNVHGQLRICHCSRWAGMYIRVEAARPLEFFSSRLLHLLHSAYRTRFGLRTAYRSIDEEIAACAWWAKVEQE